MIRIIWILMLFCSLSCRTYQRDAFIYRSSEVKYSDKRFFIKQFKDRVFYKSLHYGYGSELYKQIGELMLKKDLFSPCSAEYLDIDIDSIETVLAKNVIQKLPKPFLHVEDPSSIEGKNFIISTCLSYYESIELDSIAQKLYKEKVKSERKNRYLYRGK